MGDGFTINSQNLLSDANNLAIAAGDWQDCAKTLANATMPNDMLGMIGSKADLPSVYNAALQAMISKVGDAVTSMENSIKAIEKAVQNYDGTDQASMDKIVYAGSDLTQSSLQHTKPTN
jgi:hypothetical protein